jgi:hypothetical protein
MHTFTLGFVALLWINAGPLSSVTLAGAEMVRFRVESSEHQKLPSGGYAALFIQSE